MSIESEIMCDCEFTHIHKHTPKTMGSPRDSDTSTECKTNTLDFTLQKDVHHLQSFTTRRSKTQETNKSFIHSPNSSPKGLNVFLRQQTVGDHGFDVTFLRLRRLFSPLSL